MSSKGQVVIPLDIRERMNLSEGEKFVVVGDEDMICLKKIKMPSFKNFDKLLKKTQDFAKERGVKKEDLDEAVKRARK